MSITSHHIIFVAKYETIFQGVTFYVFSFYSFYLLFT